MAKLSKWAIFVRVFLVTLIAGQATRAGGASPAELEAWRNATSQNTAAAYYGYLSRYPAGDFVEQAINALVGLGAINNTSPGRQIPNVSPSPQRQPAAPRPNRQGLY